MDDRPILVTGGAGQLGTALRRVIPTGLFIDRDELDLTKPDDVDDFVERSMPSAVINCAAYTAVDAAEADFVTAGTVNGDAVGTLAGAAARLGVAFVTFSTDYVFDGTADKPYIESDEPNPVNAYGASKLLGESLALDHHPSPLILRTSWLLSGTHRNFATAILERAISGAVKVVDDQTGRPTMSSDLANATVRALGEGRHGVMHLTNRGETTWYELARAIVLAADLDPDVVAPCGSDEFPTLAPRPRYSVLGSERVDRPPMPHWRDSVGALAAQQMAMIRSAGQGEL